MTTMVDCFGWRFDWQPELNLNSPVVVRSALCPDREPRAIHSSSQHSGNMLNLDTFFRPPSLVEGTRGGDGYADV